MANDKNDTNDNDNIVFTVFVALFFPLLHLHVTERKREEKKKRKTWRK